MLLLMILLGVLPLALGYGIGAPPARCLDMDPSGHGVNPQNGTPPFVVTLNVTSYSANDVIEVRVTLIQGMYATFKGFMLQMRQYTYPNNSTPQVGLWSLQSDEQDYKLLTCGGVARTAVTHTKSTEKTNATLYWTAPSSAAGHVHVVGTVVQVQTVYWRQASLKMLSEATTTNGAAKVSLSLLPLLVVASLSPAFL